MKAAFLFVDESESALLKLDLATRFFERLRGLLGRSSLPDDLGIWIAPCGSVHTFGMGFPIDVVFVDRAGTICRVAERVAAGRMAFARKSASVVELAAGSAQRFGLQRGQRLSWSETIGGRRLPLARGAVPQRRQHGDST